MACRSALPLLLSLGLSVLSACSGESENEPSPTPNDSPSPVESPTPDETPKPTAAPSPTPMAQPLELTLLHLNDHHSHLRSETLTYDVGELELSAVADAAGSPLLEVELSYGGFPLLVSLFDELEQSSEHVLKLHAGDALTGTLYYTLFEGEADALMMNHVCFDAFTIGNHEFDNGDAGLSLFLDDLAMGGCDTPALAANIVPGSSSPLAEGYLRPYHIAEVDGQQVGIIGIATAQKTKNSSSPDPDTEFLDEAETAQQYIDTLSTMGINKIVVLSHFGYENDLVLASQLSGVDVIVDGDSHSLLGDEDLSKLGFSVVGEYPTRVQDASGNPVCVVQAWEYAHLLGRLDVRFDAAGEVTACDGSPLLPIDQSAITYGYKDESGVTSTKTLNEADTALVLESLAAIDEVVPVLPDADVTQDLSAYDEQVEELEQTVIGSVAEVLCLERFPGQARSTLCNVSEIYEHGSDVGDVVAQAFLAVSPTADLCIQNAGGVRVDIADGDFTIADAYTVLPFSNTLVTLELTGEQVIRVLEDALSNHLDDDGSSGSYPYSAGLRYHVNASAAFGSRITGVEVNTRLEGSFTAIDPTAVYTVVTNSFIASGQDGYDTFGEVYSAGLYVDLYTEYAQALIDYLESLTLQGKQLENRPVEQASTQSYTGRDGCNHSERSDCTGY